MLDKTLGGWLGRCSGCLLGKPVEGLTKDRIEEWLELTKRYPLANFFPTLKELPEETPRLLREHVEMLEKIQQGDYVGDYDIIPHTGEYIPTTYTDSFDEHFLLDDMI